MSTIWLVRAGRGGAFVDDFRDLGLIAIGFNEKVGPEAIGLSRSELGELLARNVPGLSRRAISSNAGQVYRFLSEMQVDEDVLTYDPSRRIYLLGKLVDSPRHDPEPFDDLQFVRRVNWTSRVARDALSVSTRNSLGAIQTIIRLDEGASDEIRRLAVPLDSPDVDELSGPTDHDSNGPEEDNSDPLGDAVTKSEEFIEDMLARLGPYEMQDLVAGILRAMGYKTRVAAPGPDRGVDITASPDGLGLQEPRIFVEVKHRRSSSMGSQEIRTFLGGRQPGDRCLYVSTGGFSKDARYEAERSNVPITLLGLPELRSLLVEHYEALDVETKRMVPLRRIYWPVGSD